MNKIYKTFAVLTISLFMVSCSEDDHTGLSSVNYTQPAVTLSSSENNVSLSEDAIGADGYTITVTATIAEARPINIIVPLVQTGGSADSDDFSAGSITIAAGSLSGSTTVTVYATGDVEGNETLNIGAGDIVANATVNPFTLTVNITDDFINDVLNVTVDWSGTATIDVTQGELTVSFCDLDLDLLIYDSNFADTGIYDAATGACPEHVDLSGMADGTYYLVANVYDNPFTTIGAGAAIPITLSYEQEYFQEGEIVFSGLTTDTPSGTDLLVATVEVMNGYVYTVTAQ